MPELEILEAKVPVRTPRAGPAPAEAAPSRFAPVAGWLSGPVLQQFRTSNKRRGKCYFLF